MGTELYKVVKIQKASSRKKVLERDLTLDEAKRLVNNTPSSPKSMVIFTKQ